MADDTHGAATQATASAAPKLEVTRGENTGETFKVGSEAKISLDNGQWQIIDLDSANGTQVNGATVSNPVTLKSGDRITLGETELIFQVPAATGVPAPAPAVSTPAVGPTPAVPAHAVTAKKSPRLAWIAGGIILFVCFAAVSKGL